MARLRRYGVSVKNLLRMRFSKFAVSFILLPIPFLILVVTLVKMNRWPDAVQALLGQYSTHGVPFNPWADFLPALCISVIAFVVLFWLMAIVRSSSWPVLLKVITNVLLSVLGSIGFGVSITIAVTVLSL